MAGPVHRYGVGDVEKLLRLPRSTIRAMIDAGFVTPTRGPRKSLQFSFQDLIVLRTAQALAAAKVPAKRITRSLKELRRQLPETMPLSGLAIGAVGERVVVRDGAGQRQVDSGQYLLAFGGDPAAGSLKVIERAPAASPPGDTPDWFARGVALEQQDSDAAQRAYEQALAAEPARLDARINLGRLLHEAGKLARAEQVYRDALAACGEDPVLLYNLAVLLEDRDRKAEALEAYQAALRGDPALADGHYNLALLCQKLDRPKDAIRHMSQYRRLTAAQ
ncbi:MAG TPA: tetratricopeptide repeat protein [Candidatus Binatia bacterium]|nr:tetratricopeptide repeat protein [Candidatus Binatia bacterium]